MAFTFEALVGELKMDCGGNWFPREEQQAMEDHEAEGWYDEDCDPADHGPQKVRQFDPMAEEFPLSRVPEVLRKPISKPKLREWVNVGIAGRRLPTERRGNQFFVRRDNLLAFVRHAFGQQ